MRPYDFRARTHVRLICCLLSYVLLSSPLATPARMAVAPSDPKGVTGRAMNSTPASRIQAEAPRREGEMLVRFREGVTEQGRNVTASSTGARRKDKLRGDSRAERLELRAGQDAAEVVEQLRRRPEVELVEPNFLVARDQFGPDDIRFPEQWALRNTGQSGGAVGSDVNAPAAWRATTGSPSTVVAVIDSGIDFSHPDLKNNRWVNAAELPGNRRDDDNDGLADDVSGWDWVTNSGDVRDEQGHGTAVAGIIAAEGGNVEGISGVMWHASLMSLRVLDSTETGDVASAVEAIDYAVAHGAQVINCSWGTDADSQFLKDAIERAGRRGVVVVASAGNGGRDIDAQPYYPASYDLSNLISVASSDGFDALAHFSNRGSKRVAVAAPGTDILTTQPGGSYSWVTGTSASAPLVAGIAGLIKTLRPNAQPAAVRSAVVNGARVVASLSGKVSSGGVADAASALAALRGNPYGGNGNGVNGRANGNGRPYVPPALRPDNDQSRAHGQGGFVADAPPASGGAPGDNLPDLNESDRTRKSPTAPALSAPIQSNLMCADCDPSGGGGAGGDDPYFATARSRPVNATGGPEVTLGSRNFNWELPVVALRGRAGLDLSVVLYYNSLVWAAQGNNVQYNPDHGTPAPGFQIGMPRLQRRSFDFDNPGWAYTMVTSSGGRVKIKQVGTTSVYESLGGDHTQLTFSGTTPVVRTTDGTQYVFGLQVGAEWRCTQVKDRNGNFITAEYDPANGHLLRLKDTLWVTNSANRVVNFNYNADGTLNTITQNWGGATHTYAQFVYGSVTLSPNFTPLNAIGVPGGGVQTVLSYVTLADGQSYNFDYNSYGQVYQIRHKAPDGHELGHTRYNMSNADLGGGPQSDCPRFTARYEYAQDWNSNQEAATTYSVTSGVTWQNPETLAQESGARAQETAPDGTTYKEFYHSAGWDAGLPRYSEVWATENNTPVLKRWASTNWTQDNTTVGYQKNPRITEINVYDSSGNRSRVAISYGSYAQYNLPYVIEEFGTGGTSVLRRTIIDYNLDAAYVDRRIVGLPFQRMVYDGNWALVSKEQYWYDWGGSDMFQDTPAAATQHDRTNYGPSFVTGRGNLSNAVRFDVNDPNNANGTAQETKYRYNAAGSPLMQRDHLWHAKYLDYADSFSDSVNRNTFAYPTKMTDEDGYFSTSQYNYDFGAVTLTHSPTSGTGAGTTYVDLAMQYDSFGRLQQVKNQTLLTYRKWQYDLNGNYVHRYETINGNTAADEFHSWNILDGAGRVRASASDHFGSAGGFAGQYIVYDVMGRPSQRSNPVEIDANWNAVGDDVLNQTQNTGGWRYTLQAYDWKGRPTQTTNTDGTTRVLTYGGCGCAGGEVVTAQDEHGRRSRYTRDVLDRLAKVEELDWSGSVYSTTQYAYNVRDQLTQITQQAQTRSFDYDGRGRLWHRTTPEQGTTAYAYNADDTVASVTDARGAKTNISYTGRHLPNSISYDLSGVAAGQNVASTAAVSYTYDAAGNRTSMNDGMGASTYHYDNLGRMDWEQRTFNTGPGSTIGPYTINYGYNPGGELASITNHWSAQVSYAYDRAGRMTAVNGSGYLGLTNYASGITYRAFGAVKGMSYADGRTLATSYDRRLRLTKWDVAGVLGYKYYYNDFNEKTGRVTYAQSVTGQNTALDRSQTSSPEDRSYEYDHVGRLIYAHSGAESKAHAIGGPWGTMDGAYSHGYEYDPFGNMTHRYGWGGEVQGGSAGQTSDLYYSYTNNRRNGYTYDNAGNLTYDGGPHFTYDATGQQTYVDFTDLRQYYDGDGLRVKKTESGGSVVKYYLRSTMLGGQVLAEINGGGAWQRGYVYAGGGLIAVQQGGVFFTHEDPVTKSKRVVSTGGVVQSATELDPWGGDTGHSSNAAFQPRKFTSYERDANGSDDAMFRRYNRWHSRFDQPDPYGGSYDMTDPQSFNRYAYVKGNPVSYTDNSGLDVVGFNPRDCIGAGGEDICYHQFIMERAIREGCDDYLASIFGGPGAVGSAMSEPNLLTRSDDTIDPRSGMDRGPYGHSAAPRNDLNNTTDRGGVIHLYTDVYGSDRQVGLYAPPGYIGTPSRSTYPDNGGLSNRYAFTYPGNLTIVFVHVGNVNSRSLPVGLNPNDRNEAGSVRIGDIAGPGGDSDAYRHSHIAFYSEYTGNPKTGTRVDPRNVFCSYPGWAWSENSGRGGFVP